MSFFGLQPQHRPQIHEEIFQLIYYGKGFNHSDVYSMPTYLRRFYLTKLIDAKKKENDQIEKANKKVSNTSNPNIQSKFKR